MAVLEDSGFGRLIGVMVAPVKTFRSIAERATWGTVLLVVMVLSTCVGVLTQSRIDPDSMRQMVKEQMEKRQGGKASPEQVEQAAAMGRKVGAVVVWLVPVFIAIVDLIVAALFLAAFRFFGGSEIPFKTSFATTMHAYVPGLVAALLTLPLLLSRQHISVKEAQGGGILASNLGAFAPESTGPAVKALLSSLDFFSLWTLALFIVGYRLTAKVSTATAASVTLVLWVLYVAAKVGWAAVFG
jgi:hypothetical protein